MDKILKTGVEIYVYAARFILPVLCVLLLIVICKSLFRKHDKIILAKLITANGLDFDISSVESIIGRSKVCDVILNIPSISRRHAVITYGKDYGFKISSVYDTPVVVNGTEIDGFAYIDFGDIIEIGGLQLKLVPSQQENAIQKPQKNHGFLSLLLLTLIQLIICSELLIHFAADFKYFIPVSFAVLIGGEWIYMLISRFKDNIHIEIIGFFLTTIGFAVAASATPDEMLKQLLTAILGVGAFIVLQLVFKNIDLVMKLRYAAGAVSILIFGYNIIFGITLNGAKNWISIAGYSFQPSELVKFLFIFTTAATLERLLSKRNLILFLGFSCACMGSLVLMRDFGTCAIFFITTLIILYMRSGDVKIVGSITLAAGAGGFLVAKFVPYVQRRFSTYRHVWEYASDKGYQQTRTMIAIASGALLGVGGGNGNLKYVSASDTDLVFGLVCEEWGMIVAFCAIFCFIIFALYALKCTPNTNSAFFAIAAVSAAGLWIFQISLNIFGSTDLLPLTGVTLPFISNGGSSMISSWLLLSFIKAVGKNRLKQPAYDEY